MKKILYATIALSALFTACSNDDDNFTITPATPNGTMELQGGEGASMARNSVYVDFSEGEQESIERASWNLALHCGSEFGVRLNNTIGSRAMETTQGVTMATVFTQEDVDGFMTTLAPAMGTGDFTTADLVTSETDLSGTIIKRDKIYIYSSDETNKVVYKVSVAEKNSTTYAVSYSLWNSSAVTVVDIEKDSDEHFTGISFTTKKEVDVQPDKDEWDIVWGRSSYTSAMAVGVPFMISDVVFLNTKSGVKAQEIIVTPTLTYESYTDTEAATAQLSSEIDVIGSKWRNGGGPTTAPSVKTDRFYVIKDAQGNVYKLGFVSMNEGEDGGRRGYPELKYTLLIAAK